MKMMSLTVLFCTWFAVGCGDTPGVDILIRMPSFPQITEAGLVNPHGREDVDALVRQTNSDLARFSSLDPASQRRALNKFLDRCESWILDHPSTSSEWRPRARPPSDSLALDCGKLDVLALAQGKPPQLYKPAQLSRFRQRAPLGIVADQRIVVTASFGYIYIPSPIFARRTVEQARVLVNAGYYDVVN